MQPVENGIRRIVACKLKGALDLPSQGTNDKPAALPVNGASGKKELAKTRSGHVSETVEVNDQVDGIVVFGQRAHRISQVFRALHVEATRNRENFNVPFDASLKRGHNEYVNLERVIFTTDSSCSTQLDFYLWRVHGG